MMTPTAQILIMISSAISVICFTSLVGAANVTSSFYTDTQFNENVYIKQYTLNSPTTKRDGNINIQAPGSDAESLYDSGIRNTKMSDSPRNPPGPSLPGWRSPYYGRHNRYSLSDEMVDIDAAVKRGFMAQNDYCKKHCVGSRLVDERIRCNENNFKCRSCYCDTACKHYRDCCPSMGKDEAPNMARNDIHGCLEVMVGFDRESITTINSCPEASATASERFEGKTGSVGYSLHSTDGTKPGLNHSVCGYESTPAVSLDTRAVYCSTEYGQCNRETNLMSLPHTTCLDSGETVFIWNHRDNENLNYPGRLCNKKTMYSTPHIDTCNSNITSRHVHGDEMTALCQQYSYPVYAEGASYRNIFCALCNGLLLYRRGCSRPTTDGPTGPLGARTTTTPIVGGGLDTITSLRPLYIYKTVGPRQCLDDQWYDTARDLCRNITCHEKRVRAPGQLYCEDPNVANSSLLLYTLNPTFTVVTNVTHVPCLHDWSPVREAIISHLAQTLQNLNVTTYALQVTDFNKYFGKFDAFVEFIMPKSTNQTEYELKMVEAFVPSELSFTILGDRMIELRTHVTLFKAIYFARTTLVSFLNGSCCDVVNDITFSLKTKFNKYFPNYTEAALSTIQFSPLMPFTKVVLNDSEYEYSDDSLLLTYANISLPMWQSENGTDELYVPAVYLQQAYEVAGMFPEPLRYVKVALPSDPVHYILSLCCLVVSIVSLIFLLVTYGTFSQLRSLPGLNNMWLATWLLLAQLLLLIVLGLTQVNGCHVLGMVLHYAWLCVISWSCVCSVHMFHVFVTRREKMLAPHSDSWYMKRYIAISHAIPAVIVGLVVGCTLVLTKSQDTGYGGHVCYLNTVVLRGVAFVLPLALAVIMNIVLLALTACTLSREEQPHNLGRQSEPSYIRIYAKLSSLTGFCWFFAIIAEVPGCEWMLYLSTVLNGLQGVHLAVSYAVNKRVLKLWKEKILCKEKKSEKRSSESSGPLAVRHTDSTQSSSV